MSPLQFTLLTFAASVGAGLLGSLLGLGGGIIVIPSLPPTFHPVRCLAVTRRFCRSPTYSARRTFIPSTLDPLRPAAVSRTAWWPAVSRTDGVSVLQLRQEPVGPNERRATNCPSTLRSSGRS